MQKVAHYWYLADPPLPLEIGHCAGVGGVLATIQVMTWPHLLQWVGWTCHDLFLSAWTVFQPWVLGGSHTAPGAIFLLGSSWLFMQGSADV